ncbi:MAG TPA: glucosaminidase domain-containing protein, partial [Acidimicrobiia bacterium]|nr:glucosaminidase domain-containing protein [Acidimicrobiia bacterium]
FVSEGNRYNVRGDIAFAQSIVETAWFNFPDYGIVKPWNNNFSGIGACDSCGNGFQFSTPVSGVRAQIQLLRNYADLGSRVTNIPDPPVPELWGSNPSTAAYNFDNYFAKGRAPLWNNMGNGNWATAPNYATTVLRVYNQILTFNGKPGQCPADGLTFGPLTDAGPCPVSIRQPGRAVAANGGGYYVLNGDGTVNAYRGAPGFGSPSFTADLARDIAVMPDGQGYVVLDAFGRVFKFGSATRTDTIGSLDSQLTFPNDGARSIAIMPDGKGYLELLGNGTVAKFGSAAVGDIGALGEPGWAIFDFGRSIQVMPDGKGYLVLDMFGGVSKYGSATTGLVGSAATPTWSSDVARDFVLVSDPVWGPLGYIVLDLFGGVNQSAVFAPLKNPSYTWLADRWRGIAGVGNQLLLLKNDGFTTFATP